METIEKLLEVEVFSQEAVNRLVLALALENRSLFEANSLVGLANFLAVGEVVDWVREEDTAVGNGVAAGNRFIAL